MTYAATLNKKIYENPNGIRFREMLGIKQDALAYELGEDWKQKKASPLEQKESIELALLQQISNVLKIPVEAFLNFDEEKAINIIANKFHDSAVANTFKESSQANFNCTFNPIDKIVELYDEKIALYERMLKEKDEMMARLEKLIK